MSDAPPIWAWWRRLPNGNTEWTWTTDAEGKDVAFVEVLSPSETYAGNGINRLGRWWSVAGVARSVGVEQRGSTSIAELNAVPGTTNK